MAKVNQSTGEVVMRMDPEGMTNVGVLNMIDMIESLDRDSLIELAAYIEREYKMPEFKFSLLREDGTFQKHDIRHMYDPELLKMTGRELRERLSNDDEG